MKPPRAKHFGIVIDRKLGAIVRIFNPDYEFEFNYHHIGEHEVMYKIEKASHNIGEQPNSMGSADVYRILQTYGTIVS